MYAGAAGKRAVPETVIQEVVRGYFGEIRSARAQVIVAAKQGRR